MHGAEPIAVKMQIIGGKVQKKVQSARKCTFSCTCGLEKNKKVQRKNFFEKSETICTKTALL